MGCLPTHSTSTKTVEHIPLGTFLWKIRLTDRSVKGKEDDISQDCAFLNKAQQHTFPQAPSPTMTSFLLISDIWEGSELWEDLRKDLFK